MAYIFTPAFSKFFLTKISLHFTSSSLSFTICAIVLQTVELVGVLRLRTARINSDCLFVLQVCFLDIFKFLFLVYEHHRRQLKPYNLKTNFLYFFVYVLQFFVSVRIQIFVTVYSNIFSFLYYSFTFKYLLQFIQIFFRFCTTVFRFCSYSNICYNLFKYFFVYVLQVFVFVRNKYLLQFFRFCITSFCSFMYYKYLFYRFFS